MNVERTKRSERERIGVGVGALLVRRGQLLLGKRHEDPQKAKSALHGEGTWTLPGGKARFHERLAEAARREVLEETGLEIRAQDLFLVSVAEDMAEDAHFVTAGFAALEVCGEPRTLEPDQIVEWRWFSFDQLPQPLFPASSTIIRNYLSGTVYDQRNHHGDMG